MTTQRTLNCPMRTQAEPEANVHCLECTCTEPEPLQTAGTVNTQELCLTWDSQEATQVPVCSATMIAGSLQQFMGMTSQLPGLSGCWTG